MIRFFDYENEDVDDLIEIGRPVYLVNVYKFAKIGASKSSRLQIMIWMKIGASVEIKSPLLAHFALNDPGRG